MKKPKFCVEPEETQDEYCMTDADLGNLTNLLQVESFRDTVFGMRRIQKSEKNAPSAGI